MTEHLIEKQARTSEAITRELRAIKPQMHKLLNQMLLTTHVPTRRRLLDAMNDLEAAALARAYKLASAA